MNKTTRDGLIRHLSQYVSQNKIDKINRVLKYRTRYLTLILEDIYKPHNASAAIRTCECFGVQDIHIVENTSPFSLNEDVTQGSSKWVTLHRYNEKNKNNTQTCIKALQNNSYKIVATTPDGDSRSLEKISFDTRLAFIFGNEEEGLSDDALQAADARVTLPLYGFTQSYNISVSVAILLSRIMDKRYQADTQWQMTENEKAELTLTWYRKIVRASDLIEKAYLEQQNR